MSMIDLPTKFAEYLKLDADEPTFEVATVWQKRQVLVDIAVGIERLLAEAGVATDAPIGLIARNRVPQICALIALIGARRGVVMLHAYQPPAVLGEDFERSRFAAVIGDAEDWAKPELPEGARKGGTVGLVLTHDAAAPLRFVPGLERLGVDPHHQMEKAGIEVLTSGTTGPPKRVALSYATLGQSIGDAAVATAQGGVAATPAEKPYLQFFPLGNISGIYGLLLAIAEGRRVAMMEKFSVAEWVRMMRAYRPSSFVSLPPAALRMVLEADVPKEVFASAPVVRCGSAPLDPVLQIAFEEKYDIPVLINYGATEFCGVVANWTLADHQQFAKSKRGSVGRARPGITLRIVDPDTGAELPAGEIGRLEVLVPRMGPDWVRTTDIALIDADGFMFLQGRADSVINRGGFKIYPEHVSRVLARHPGVLDSTVIAVPDSRLGEVPHAVIEPRKDTTPPTEAELRDLARLYLPAQSVPVAFHFVDAIPRTGSLKVDRGTLHKMFGGH